VEGGRGADAARVSLRRYQIRSLAKAGDGALPMRREGLLPSTGVLNLSCRTFWMCQRLLTCRRTSDVAPLMFDVKLM
jgi:hypothetical protein